MKKLSVVTLFLMLASSILFARSMQEIRTPSINFLTTLTDDQVSTPNGPIFRLGWLHALICDMENFLKR